MIPTNGAMKIQSFVGHVRVDFFFTPSEGHAIMTIDKNLSIVLDIQSQLYFIFYHHFMQLYPDLMVGVHQPKFTVA